MGIHRSSLVSVLVAVFAVAGVLVWSGCGNQGEGTTAPPTAWHGIDARTLAAEGEDIGQSTADEMVEQVASGQMTEQELQCLARQQLPAGPEGSGEAPAREIGTMSLHRGYTEFAAPWAHGSANKSHTGCVATINPSTGVGRAYARGYPNTATWAQCSVANTPPGTALRYTGPTRSGNVILKTPSMYSGFMVRGLAASASAWLTVQEYLPNGQFSRNYEQRVDWISCVGSFSRDLNGRYLSIDLKTNYLYRITIWAYANASSGSTPQTGSATDISSAQLKKVWIGY